MSLRPVCLRYVLLLLSTLAPSAASVAVARPASAPAAAAADQMSELRQRLQTSALGAPLRFEPNRGQSDPRVRFLARGTGYGLFLTDEEAVMRFMLDSGDGAAPREPAPAAVLRLRLEDATPVRPQARLRQEGHSSYLSLDGSRAPIADLPHYSELVYRGRYPGIDVVYYGRDGELEYDFVLAPEADPGRIALRFEGADALRVGANGDLLIEVAGRTLVQRAPIAFQYGDVALAATPDATRLRHSAAARIPVASRYVLDRDGRVRFELGGYDRSRPLVIDPVFAYSSCLGGSGYDAAEDLALGPNGEVYVVGHTASADFPVAGPIHGYGGATEIFVTKINAAGNGAIYSTYAGGNPDSQAGMGIAVNAAGEAHVVGFTQSATTFHIRAFLMKLNAAGNAAVFSNVFGGSGSSFAYEVALDSSGNSVVVGTTSSIDFPVLNALQGAAGGGNDAFVRRYSPTGAVLSSSYLGGANDQVANAVAIGPDDAIHLAGRTHVADATGDAFVIKLNAAASAVSYSRPLGGSARDDGGDIVVDAGSRAYLVGSTSSSNFPALNGLDTSYGGNEDGFLAILDASGQNLSTTFLGDSGQEVATGVALGPAGDVYVTGSKHSSDGDRAPFLVKIGPAFNTVGYSSRIGWTSYDGNTAAVRVDGAGAAYVVGRTHGGYPTTPGALLCPNASDGNGFVSKIVEGAPSMRVSDASVVEGASGQQSAEFQVTLDAYPLTNVRFTAATADGTAVAGSDYFAHGQSGTIYAGSSQANVYVIVTGDTQNEADETLVLNLTDPAGATLVDGQGVGTILNDDPLPSVSVSGCSTVEGSGGNPACTFSVSLSAASGRVVSVNVGTVAGTAGANVDYQHLDATTISFQPGETSKAVGIAVFGDTLDEPDEAFQLALSSPQNATLATGAAVGTIVDDDASPALSIDNGGCAVTEGHSGSVACVFTARLSAPSAKPVTFISATADGSAGGADYAGHGATAYSMAPGQTALGIAVPVHGDTLDEDNEGFALQLSSIANATPGAVSATGTVVDDDAAPGLSVDGGGCALSEGNGGASNCNFVVRLSAASSRTVSFTSATADGSAASGSDYSGHGATARAIAAGQTSVTISVPVLGDTLDEDNESFALQLSSIANATPGALSATGTVLDDDAAPSLSVDAGGCAVNEGNGGATNCNFVVRLSAASSRSVSFTSATADGSAAAGSDYTGHAATARAIAAGQTSVTISVPVLGDTLDEDNESFALNLTAVGNATPASLSAAATVVDDDAAPTLSVDNGGCTVNEGSAGAVNCSFVVRLSAASGRTVAFTSATANGGATAGSDFTGHTATARAIAAGQTSLVINVPVLDDSLDEANEGFGLNLTGIGNATPGSLLAAGSIVDDDAAPTLSVDNGGCSVNEGHSGASNCNFVVRLSAISGKPVSFSSASSNGSATAGSDYTGHGVTARVIPPGSQTLTIAVPVLGDTQDEPDESFGLVLSGITDATPAGLSATGTIVDDDVPIAPGVLTLAQAAYEGTEQGPDVVVEVRRSGGDDGSVTVPYSTANGSAQDPTDYLAASGTLTFADGQTSRLLNLEINNDARVEGDEVFTLSLGQPTGGATLGVPASATITVRDDDAPPSLSIDGGGCAVVEGNSGNADCAFVFGLSGPSVEDVTFSTATANLSATAGTDYTAHNATQRNILAGQTTLTVSVPVLGDATDEPDETFRLEVGSIVNAVGVDLPGQGRILDDDGAPTLSALDASVIEGDDGTRNLVFTLVLQPAASQEVTANWSTTAGTAGAGSDYQAASGVVSFQAGQTSREVTVLVNGDTVAESDEIFGLQLTQPQNAQLGDGQGLGTILDDDVPAGGLRVFTHGFEAQ